MTTTPDSERGAARRAGDEEIVIALREIAELLRDIADRGPCPHAAPTESGRSGQPQNRVRRPEGRNRGPTARLTRREQQVLEILITGASNRVISRRLGIAERTVKNNLHAIYRKLGVGGRAEAIARVLGDRRSALPRPPQPPRVPE
jgi:DNA-binding NarL/FixJ family response regulator